MACVQTAPAEPAMRASIIGSAPKPLTALTPEMVSSTTPASAPRWRCRSEMASRTRREKRLEVTTTTGKAAMATMPSKGLSRMRITPTARARAALATQNGADATTAWIWNRSLVTRDKSWPRLTLVWYATSRKSRWSWKLRRISDSTRREATPLNHRRAPDATAWTTPKTATMPT